MANGKRGRKSDIDLAKEAGLTVDEFRAARKAGNAPKARSAKVPRMVLMNAANLLAMTDKLATLAAEEQTALTAAAEKVAAEYAAKRVDLSGGVDGARAVLDFAITQSKWSGNVVELLARLQAERLARKGVSVGPDETPEETPDETPEETPEDDADDADEPTVA